ncbi:ribonuclease H-like domain-containing protein [Mrakia frigida]|uniref:ribonuclease H-like domain-containing protein n=1 Tax=Mrakia frigida TaxID=29902 RepID=UPI003FCBF345
MPRRSLDASASDVLIKKPSSSDSVEVIKASLSALGLPPTGKKETILKRLKKAWHHYTTSAAQEEKEQEELLEKERLKRIEAEKKDFHQTARGKYKAFLVLDIEGTCESGKSFDFPNEVIEFPVVLVKWRPIAAASSSSSSSDPQPLHHQQELYVVDTFQTYVRPTWRPKLTLFATSLTGITQEQVDKAPTFIEILPSFLSWMKKHGLEHLDDDKDRDWLWVTDGAFDLRDFIAKQSFISKIPHPWYLAGDILDLKEAVAALLTRQWEERGGFDAPSEVAAIDPPPSTTEDPSTTVVEVESKLRMQEDAPPSAEILLGEVVEDLEVVAAAVEPSSEPSLNKEALAVASEPALVDVGVASLVKEMEGMAVEENGGVVASSPSPIATPSLPPSSLLKASTTPPSNSNPSHFTSSNPPPTSSDLPLSPETPPANPSTSPSPSPSPVVADPSPTPPKAKKRKNNKKKKPPKFYYNVTDILSHLNMAPFEGRPHSGIDDAKNIARILIEVESRGVLLEPNRFVRPGDRRWGWMGENGRLIWEREAQE